MPEALPPAKPLTLQHCLHTPGPFAFPGVGNSSQIPPCSTGRQQQTPTGPISSSAPAPSHHPGASPSPKELQHLPLPAEHPSSAPGLEAQVTPTHLESAGWGNQHCSTPQHPKPHRYRAQPFHLGSLPMQELVAKSRLGSSNRLLCFGSWILQTRALIIACFYAPRAKIVLLSTVSDQYSQHRTFQWLLVWVIIPGLPLFPS